MSSAPVIPTLPLRPRRREAARHPAAAAADGDQFLQLHRSAGRLRDDAEHRRGVPPLQLQARAARLGNLIVFAIASLDLGPDRRPHRAAQGDLHRASWSGRSPPSARRCRLRSRCCCSFARWSASARAPTARAPTRCCARTRRPKSGDARSGIYNVGMALGATSGLVLGAMLAPRHRLARRVLDRGRSVDAARRSARRLWPRPTACERPRTLPARSYLLAPTYLHGAGGRHPGHLRRQLADLLVRTLVIEERHFSVAVGNAFMAVVGLVCGVGGVIVGRLRGRRLQPAPARRPCADHRALAC